MFSNSKWTAIQSRILPLILALLLSLSILPGCSGSSNVEPSDSESSTSVEQSVAEDAEEKVAAPEPAEDEEAVFDVAQVPSFTGSPYTVIRVTSPALPRRMPRA